MYRRILGAAGLSALIIGSFAATPTLASADDLHVASPAYSEWTTPYSELENPAQGVVEGEDADVADRQADPVNEALVALAQRIYSIVDPTEGAKNVTADGEDYGYAGLRIHPDNGALDLYWVGEVPGHISALIADSPRISVSVLPARYTLFEMQDASLAVLESRTTSFADGVTVRLTGPRVEGDGIVMEYSRATESPSDAAGILEDATGIARMPVLAEEVPDSEPAFP